MPHDPMHTVSLNVTVLDTLGLHARPAARLAQTALGFEASITLTLGQATADAKSILEVLALSAAKGSELHICCQGADAQQAASAMQALFHPTAPLTR